jgi:5-methylcytosine-specific restriction endonuclease McrA
MGGCKRKLKEVYLEGGEIKRPSSKSERCQLCQRPFDYSYGRNRKKFSTGPPTAHHLIPRQKGGKKGEKIYLCVPCHKQIHKMFDNGELKKNYSTLEKLLESEKVRTWVEWIRRR